MAPRSYHEKELSFRREEQEQLTTRQILTRDAEIRSPKGRGSYYQGLATAGMEVRRTTAWIWSGFLFIIVVLLIAGTGTALIMRLFFGLGWYFWLIAIVVILIWRRR